MRKGFTLIELMLVVAIIGLLAAIAIPKFANLVVKAKEANIKGKLGSLRSAVNIYYADNEGIFPAFCVGVIPKYLLEIPFIQIPTVPTHLSGNANTWVGLHDTGLGIVDEPSWDGGNENAGGWIMVWGYSNVTGRIVVNCSHTDTRGSLWSAY